MLQRKTRGPWRGGSLWVLVCIGVGFLTSCQSQARRRTGAVASASSVRVAGAPGVSASLPAVRLQLMGAAKEQVELRRDQDGSWHVEGVRGCRIDESRMRPLLEDLATIEAGRRVSPPKLEPRPNEEEEGNHAPTPYSSELTIVAYGTKAKLLDLEVVAPTSAGYLVRSKDGSFRDVTHLRRGLFGSDVAFWCAPPAEPAPVVPAGLSLERKALTISVPTAWLPRVFAELHGYQGPAACAGMERLRPSDYAKCAERNRIALRQLLSCPAVARISALQLDDGRLRLDPSLAAASQSGRVLLGGYLLDWRGVKGAEPAPAKLQAGVACPSLLPLSQAVLDPMDVIGAPAAPGMKTAGTGEVEIEYASVLSPLPETECSRQRLVGARVVAWRLVGPSQRPWNTAALWTEPDSCEPARLFFESSALSP